MRHLVTALAVSSLLVSASATAGEPAPNAAPLIGPPAEADPPAEAGLGSVQLVAGALATFGTTLALFWAADRAKADPLAVLGVAAGPGMGGWAVCALGRLSSTYDGDCLGTILSSYLGSVVLAIPAGVLGCYVLAPSISNGDRTFGALEGGAAGFVIGAAVGATIGWHLTKHRRDQAPAQMRVPVPPGSPTVVTYDWSDLGPRKVSRPAGAAFSVPLLTLRF